MNCPHCHQLIDEPRDFETEIRGVKIRGRQFIAEGTATLNKRIFAGSSYTLAVPVLYVQERKTDELVSNSKA